MELYPEHVEDFRRDLAAAGFVRVADTAWDVWVGPVNVDWFDPGTSRRREATHRLQVELQPGFPFRRPAVYPLDELGRDLDAAHRAPVQDGVLCLWPPTQHSATVGWHPSMSGADLLARVREWLRHYYLGDWEDADRQPDLHTQFPAPGGVRLMLISDDWCTPAGATSGRFGVWESSLKGGRFAFAGRPVAGLSEVPKEHQDRLFEYLSLNPKRFSRAGVWFQLHEEPRARKTLREMLGEIDRAARQEAGWSLREMRRLLGRGPYRSAVALIALGYPAPDASETRWLFVQTRPAGSSLINFNRPEGLERYGLEAYETAPCSKDALMRRTGHTAEQLAGKSVLLFGVGAIGSAVAVLLAKAGVERVRLVDGDRIRPTNAVRHEVGIWRTGAAKTTAVAWEIHQHAPDCEVICEQATWDPSRLSEWMEQADLVLDCTADEPFSLLVNELAVRAAKPAVYAVTRRRAQVGEILVVRPGQDPCVVCNRSMREDNGYPLVPPGDEGAFMEVGCGVPTVQASAVDVEATANVAARTALRLLSGRTAAGNHLILVNEALEGAAEPLDSEGLHAFMRERTACETCGDSGH